MDIDEDSDEETRDLNDLKYLTAVLEAETCTNDSTFSQSVITAASTSYRSILTSSELCHIESTLALNRLYDEKLVRLEKILNCRLNECEAKLKEIKGLGLSSDKQEEFRYISCGKPYFRDKSNFPAPDNEDSILVKSQMFDFTDIISVSGWTVKDKTQFINNITKMSQDIRQKELTSKIAALKRKKLNKNIKKEISALEKEINNIKHKSLKQLALPIDKEYDWDLLANKMNTKSRRHTAQEFRALWKLFFHPAINKDAWTKDEQQRLYSLSKIHKQQDWDIIAKELNTGRTGYQCFVYFRTNSMAAATSQKWSNEEITYLKRLIEYFRQDNYIPWGKIAAAMDHRSKIQVYNKYQRLEEQRKGRFLPQEDAVILNCVENFGPKFKKMTHYLPGRSSSQLRTRYHVISKTRISTIWSADDDKKLMQLVSNQDKGINFSELTKHFTGKNRVNLRSRYLTLKKWIKRHPYADLEYAPRRGARRLNHGTPSEDLGKSLENLKNTLKEQARASLGGITINSSEVKIEDEIIATLINEKVKSDEYKRNINILQKQPDDSEHSTDHINMMKCLLFLESKLNKDKYMKGMYRERYPILLEADPTVNMRVKSYSRKQVFTTVALKDSPTVWGGGQFINRGQVLPPQYATITGCRSLMGYVSLLKDSTLNLPVLIKKNKVVKAHFDILLERFITLFLWPMLLSNKGPPSQTQQNDAQIFKAPTSRSLPFHLSTQTKRVNKKLKKNQPATSSIDLEDSNVKSDISIMEQNSDSKFTFEL